MLEKVKEAGGQVMGSTCPPGKKGSYSLSS
jgi:hypothetical protein